MPRLLLTLAFALSIVLPARAQPAPDSGAAPRMGTAVPPTPAEVRLDGYMQRQQLIEASLVKNVPFENVGPTVMSGRVVDLAANPDDPTIFYVAYASGGIWKTTNNGQSFVPLFDHRASMTIGDIAVAWQTEGPTVWVGTGEKNSSRSSYAGTGVYKSTDGGETWQHMGLAATHRIGRVRVHPDDPDVVWVAALGHLYSPNEERGVFMTTDGGETWKKTLYVGPRTGAIDLVVDPENPDVLYAAMWHRLRRAWNFVESGEKSGIYKSTDGGRTWMRITAEGSGFPTGEGVGRIGLAIYPGHPDVLYALLDNQYRRGEEEEEEEQPALTQDMLREMTRAEFLQVSEEALEEYLERSGFPAAYTAESVLEMVKKGEIEPIDLVRYLHDANAQLFETPVIGAQVYRYVDGGATWQKTHDGPIDDVYYSYGYYFGEIRVSPHDPQTIYILGVPILKSTDGGQTFTHAGAENVHVDHHALWIDPHRPGHLIAGNDGGVNISYDGGETWYKANTEPVGQFYSVAVDKAKPYHVYGGLQDNGVWMGPHTYEPSYGWYAEGDYPYDRLLGGDGMQVQVDTRTNQIVYTGFQFGNYFRINRATGEHTYIKPEHELGERPYRFNWNTPIQLSPHNQDILYIGSQYVHRSLDQGETWEKISPDLTQGGRKGNVPYGTLTDIEVSPLEFGLIYAGSDDGLVHVTRDGGHTWKQITDGLPDDLWVSRIEASRHDPSRVYLSLNGYRWDHFESYLYRSDDYGRTWERIGKNLPPEPINVVLEDSFDEKIFYVGTDHGLYVSLDGGETFMAFHEGLPAAPVHDLAIQEREKDLVVGTHGRSLFRADLEEVEQLPELLDETVHVFALDSLVYDEEWGEHEAGWMEPNTPEVTIPYFSSAEGTAMIRIKAEDGTVLQVVEHEAERGLNYASYDLTVDPERATDYIEAYNERLEDEEAPRLEPAEDDRIYLVPGTYTVEVEIEGEQVERTLRVKVPPEEERGGAPTPEELEHGLG